jgi:maltose O-acetyltransferase
MASIDYFAGDTRTYREQMLAADLDISDDSKSARCAQRAVQLASVLREI